MRICLLGDYSGNVDEGMKKVAYHLAQELCRAHSVLPLNAKNFTYPSFWRTLRGFRPQIVHYVPGPSILSFLLVRFIKTYCRGTKTVVSAMHPAFYSPSYFSHGFTYGFSSLFKPVLPWLKPDLVLTQSQKTETMFNQMGFRTAFLPAGVDVSKFAPVPLETKRQLREKYGLEKGRFVILHIGSIGKFRNLQVLKGLQGEDQVLIAGSTSTGVHRQLHQELKEKSCLVWTSYFDRVEELYLLSDCYVFPARDEMSAIEMPLTVLEAMSCNLPVVSTRFGALPRAFSEGEGLIFVEKEEDFLPALNQIKNGNMMVKTREKVLPYSWEKVAKKLEQIYADLLLQE